MCSFRPIWISKWNDWLIETNMYLDGPNISVSWTGTKLGPKMYFVNKHLTYFVKIFCTHGFFTKFSILWVKRTFSESYIKITYIQFSQKPHHHSATYIQMSSGKFLVNNHLKLFLVMTLHSESAISSSWTICGYIISSNQFFQMIPKSKSCPSFFAVAHE